MHQTLDFSLILYADFENTAYDIPCQSYHILLRYAIKRGYFRAAETSLVASEVNWGLREVTWRFREVTSVLREVTSVLREVIYGHGLGRSFLGSGMSKGLLEDT